MKILFIGDIYGKAGRQILEQKLPILKEKYSPDWIIANGENLTGGNGISAKHARFLTNHGIDIITTGNHVFARLDWPQMIQKTENVLRPHNIGDSNSPGAGYKIFEKPGVGKLAVINIAGRVFMEKAACPFRCADELIARVPEGIPIVVDFHAEATSEKLALFWYMDGRISAAVGTHTHVQTADERILPQGTAIISDLGMTGARDGIIGVDRKTITNRFLTGYSEKFVCANGVKKIEGAVVTVEEDFKASSIERFHLEDQ
jgi:metallophosphoesterase (TIGR00282 family)